MKKKRIISTILAGLVAVSLSVAGVAAVTTYASSVNTVATSTPGTATPGTSTPGTATPGTSTPEGNKPGTSTPEVEKPGTSTPEVEKPGTITPGTSTPEVEKPGTITPGTSTPEGSKPGTSTPEGSKPGTSIPGGNGSNVIKPVEKEEVKVDINTVVENGVTKVIAEEGSKVVMSLDVIEAAGTGSFEVRIGDVKLNIPAAILALGVGDVTLETEVLEAPAQLTRLKAVQKLFDFNLIDSKGNAITDFGKYKIDITLNLEENDLKGLNKSKLRVFYWNNNKASEWFKTSIEGTQVKFSTGHFSTFGVGEYSKSSSTGVKTGDTNNVMPLVATLVGSVLLASAVGISVLKKKKTNN